MEFVYVIAFKLYTIGSKERKNEISSRKQGEKNIPPE